MEIPIFPTLFKRTTSEGVQEWRIAVVSQPNGWAVIHIEHGLQNGKKQVKDDLIKEGKNAGRSNATTPLQQAVAEAQARWTKQRDRKHYGLTVDESAEKRGTAPMLAQKYEDRRLQIDWREAFEQPKLDGFRCLADRVGDEILFWSREGKPFVLPHITELLLGVMQDGDRFDGELYVHGLPLNTIASLVKKPRAESAQLIYNVYDSPVAARFTDRIALVQQRLRYARLGANSSVRMVETTPIDNEEALLCLQARRIAEGFEGSILRHGPLPYQAGKRTPCLLKVKTFVDDEFKIVGVKEAPKSPGQAVFICVTPDGNQFDCLAPGTHEEKSAAWNDRDKLVGQNLTIKYAYLTKTANPVPWHPVAKAIHEAL